MLFPETANPRQPETGRTTRREQLGLSQAELARRSGVRKETLCRIETGKVTPTIVTVEKLDRALQAAET